MKLHIETTELSLTVETDELTISLEPDDTRSVNEILSEFYAAHPDNSEYSEIIERLKAVDVWALDCGAWDDMYDVLGYLPPCPRCRTQMRFNEAANMLQCAACGYALDGDDYPYQSMPARDEIKDEDYRF